MQMSYLARLVKSVEDEDDGVFVGPDATGHFFLTEYRGDRFDPPLLFDFTEQEFDAAVHEAGASGTAVWPEVPAPEGGYRLLSVHLYESLSAEKPPVRRVYIADGQIWAE
jgi:hypothetical protein